MSKVLHIKATVQGKPYSNSFSLDDRFSAAEAKYAWLTQLREVAGEPDEGSLTTEVEEL